MAMTGDVAYSLAKKYTDKTLDGSGALKGEKGDKGEPGNTYTPIIGTVKTIESDEPATASVYINTNTLEATFDFSIPKGEAGQPGTTDHNELLNKSTPNQHPIKAISGLQDELTSLSEGIANRYTKSETDSKITEKVSEIVAGAPSDFDTLKEMSDWLTEHEDSAAEMNSEIQKNKADINTLKSGKVDKVSGKSLISDAEITRIAGVDNYDDSSLKNDIAINKTTLGMQCKNLLKSEAATETKNGVTFTVNTDGKITINGTCTAEYNYYCGEVKKPGKYIINGYPEDAVFDNYRIMGRITKSDNTETWFGAEFEQPITINETNLSVKIYIKVKPNVAYENVVISPMMRYADVIDSTYEAYKASLQEQINTLVSRIAALETVAGTVAEE
jgi:hypothetical protein